MTKAKKPPKMDGAFLARHPHADEYVDHDGVTPYPEWWELPPVGTRAAEQAKQTKSAPAVLPTDEPKG